MSTLGAGGLVIANVADAASPMSATTWVNLRSGPGTQHGVLGVLAPSETVTASGTVRGGWHEVTTDKGLTGWVYKTYLEDVLFSPNDPETTHKPEPIRQDAPDRKADRP
ncbi:MAG: SH3 domain-containing protein, partial [Propionibacteriaceae bacterium]|nr:SH3 domain-containing protein [Propionibacteriaceae bacterium]